MNAARLSAKVQVRLQKGSVGLVGFTGLHDQLSHRMFTAIQKTFSKTGCAVFSLAVRQIQLVKGVGNGLCCPDIHRVSTDSFKLSVDFLLALLKLLNQASSLFPVKANAPAGHLKEHREHLGLQVKDRLDFILTHLDFERLPELQGQRSVLLGVLPNIHRWKLPELLFRMDTEIGCGLLEALLTLDFLEVVETKGVEAEAESVFIK